MSSSSLTSLSPWHPKRGCVAPYGVRRRRHELQCPQRPWPARSVYPRWRVSYLLAWMQAPPPKPDVTASHHQAGVHTPMLGPLFPVASGTDDLRPSCRSPIYSAPQHTRPLCRHHLAIAATLALPCLLHARRSPSTLQPRRFLVLSLCQILPLQLAHPLGSLPLFR